MRNFNFGRGKVFELSGYDSGDGILSHQIQISPNNFRKLLRDILTQDEIETILYNCELENALAISNKIISEYNILKKDTRHLNKIFNREKISIYYSQLENFSNIDKVKEAILILDSFYRN